jgi:hypothetical protein
MAIHRRATTRRRIIVTIELIKGVPRGIHQAVPKSSQCPQRQVAVEAKLGEVRRATHLAIPVLTHGIAGVPIHIRK